MSDGLEDQKVIYVLLTFPVRSAGVVVADAAVAAVADFGSSFRRFWGGGGVARAAAPAFSETLDVRLVATFGSGAAALAPLELLVAAGVLVGVAAEALLVDDLAAAALSFFSDRTTRDEFDAFTDGSQLFVLTLSVVAAALDCFAALAAAVDFLALFAALPFAFFFFFLSFFAGAALASALFAAFSLAATAAGVDKLAALRRDDFLTAGVIFFCVDLGVALAPLADFFLLAATGVVTSLLSSAAAGAFFLGEAPFFLRFLSCASSLNRLRSTER